MGEGKGRRRRRLIVATALSMALSGAAFAAEPDWEAAWQFCKRDALNQLKAPATAKFDNISMKPGKTAGIAVYFSVDAENSYGAMLREWVICLHDPSGKSFAQFMEVFKAQVLQAADDPALHHRPPE